MTPEQLRIFLAVAEREHVTRAAGALGLTQSAVSAAIAALEAQHDVRLFDRIGRRIALTEAGAAFVGEARAVLDRITAAEGMLADLASHTTGSLTIWASQTVASYWLPGPLVAYRARHPQVELALRVANTEQVARTVAEGRADLGLVEGEIDEADLLSQTVGRDELVLVAPAGAPLDTAETTLPALLRTQSWVLREAGSGTRSVFLAWLARAGIDAAKLNVALELPSNEAVLTAVAAGGGWSALSARLVAHAVRSGDVQTRPLTGASRPFVVLSHPARHRTRAAAAMLELLRSWR